MYYITVKKAPTQHQMTVEEFLCQEYNSPVFYKNTGNTHTYAFEAIGKAFTKSLDVDGLIDKLRCFNLSTEELRAEERRNLYCTFYIPKKTKGLRKIDAPTERLAEALRILKRIFEEDFKALYHTSSFAYAKKRSTLDAVKRHQRNKSKWFCKLDLHDFFGSTTLEFVVSMLSKIFPFCEVMKDEDGRRQLIKALDLAFFNGGLPQGTPISPLITNVMMIPVDYVLSKSLRMFEDQKYIYTRYADDFIISSRYDFDSKKIEELVVNTLKDIGAPFSINASKTRYGSAAGRNWNLGVMLNKDNQITVGHKKKRIFQSMLYNYISDSKNGVKWSKEDLQILQGLHSYYHMVEPISICGIIDHINTKMSVDVLASIKEDLRELVDSF